MNNNSNSKLRNLVANPSLITMFFLGLACGFPFALTASTLKTWLTSFDITMREVGLFTFVATPYVFKFLWSPFIDGLKIPYLTNKLGQRRSWLLLIQSFLVLAIVFLARSNPEKELLYCAIAATFVSFLSASQDVVVDAYRIEKLPPTLQAMGITMYMYGYRLGLYFCGAGLLLIADASNWNYAYYSGSVIMLISLVITLCSSEPVHKAEKMLESYHAHLSRIIIDPFKDFMRTNGWFYLLLFILLFKLGDAISGSMTNPFLIKIGFTKTEIALIVKTFGLPATLFGAFVGGVIVQKYGLIRCLIFAAIIQMLSNFMFIFQDYMGHNQAVLVATITIENITGAIGDVVFVGYISSLCNVNFAATQYALLSSLASLGRNLISGTLGFIADDYGWAAYFAISMIAALPGILMLFKIRHIKRSAHSNV